MYMYMGERDFLLHGMYHVPLPYYSYILDIYKMLHGCIPIYLHDI